MSEAPTSSRFPADLRRRVQERAAEERRTLSGQVLYLVEQALGPEPREPDGPSRPRSKEDFLNWFPGVGTDGSARCWMGVWQHRSVSEPRDELAERVKRDDEAALGDVLVRAGEAADGAEAAAAADSEALDLVVRAQAGDAAAREQLIDRLLPLVSSLARRFRTEGLDQTDLVQEGIVGLLRALERYDAARGVPFAAYASWWIRQSLQDARSDFVRPFRLPPKALRQLSQLKSEHQRIYQAEQRSAGINELAERTSVELDQARSLAAADARVRSLDEPITGSEGEIGSLGDLLEDPLSADAYEQVVDTLAGQQLRALLSRLTDREREVVRARFGFDSEPQRLVDIGARLGVSAERVRQIEERALAKLRQTA
jgi:RNA polymerase sigma factor (sigma-70 family)